MCEGGGEGEGVIGRAVKRIIYILYLHEKILHEEISFKNISRPPNTYHFYSAPLRIPRHDPANTIILFTLQ